MQQEAAFVVAALEAVKNLSHPLPEGHGAYFFVAEGRAMVNVKTLEAGDATKIVREGGVGAEGVENNGWPCS